MSFARSKPNPLGVDSDSRERPGAHVSIRPSGLAFRVEGRGKWNGCVGVDVFERFGVWGL